MDTIKPDKPMKTCTICGAQFKPYKKKKTCSPECAKKHRKETNAQYYRDHTPQWKWYNETSARKQPGTTDIASGACKYANGKINFKREATVLERELKRLGLKP